MTHAFCTVLASTKRAPALGAGRLGTPVPHLASLAITPLWPVGTNTVQLLEIASPREFKECYHISELGGDLPDVREGDILTAGGVDYPVSYVGEWTDGDVPALHLVVQKVKGI